RSGRVVRRHDDDYLPVAGYRHIRRPIIGKSTSASLDADAHAIAALAGEPHQVSAAGITRSDAPLLTIENPSPFDASPKRRLVIVGGLDGDSESASAVLSAVRWLKTSAPASLRQRWAVSALPLADPDGHAGLQPFRFPPAKGFFDDPEQPESRYVWRWLVFQAPDLIIDIRRRSSEPKDDQEADGLKAALGAPQASGLGAVPVKSVIVAGGDAPGAGRKALEAASNLGQSPLHDAILNRTARDPTVIAETLATRYPESPSLSYISAVAWVNTLRLVSRTGDQSLRAKVHQQIEPWLSGEKPLFGNQITLTAVAGTMIFADLATTEAARGSREQSTLRLALEGATMASAQKAGGLPQYGQGWTDDMFMASAILAHAAAFPGHERDLDT